MDENKKDYEIAFLLKSPEALKELSGALKSQGAELVYESPLKEAALSYPIKKHNSAQFGFFHFQSNPESIAKMKEALGLSQNVLRFLIVTPPVKMASAQPRQERKPAAPVMSNEMLEGKLEEMLK